MFQVHVLYVVTVLPDILCAPLLACFLGFPGLHVGSVHIFGCTSRCGRTVCICITHARIIRAHGIRIEATMANDHCHEGAGCGRRNLMAEDAAVEQEIGSGVGNAEGTAGCGGWMEDK